jgi:hypothetical protein
MTRRVLALGPASLGSLILLLSGGCESSRTLEILEGEPENLGGATDTTASGGNLGEPPGTGGGTGGSVTSDLVIDDFVDCNGLITTRAGREGSWYPFAEPPENVARYSYINGPPPDATQECGIYLAGECPTCISAGVGFELVPEGESWDLSSYRGIRVWFESETSLWSVIVTVDQTYSEYVELLPTGGMSAERILYFSDIYPGIDFQGLELAREVQFTVGENDRASFAFGIHRVELVE